MTINDTARSTPAAPDLYELVFTEDADEIVQLATQEYERLQSEQKTEEFHSQDTVWSFLAHQVVGHEIRA